MSVARHHSEWMSLVETSGPFLSLPVLMRVFPQGLDRRDPDRALRLREGYEDWLERGTKVAGVHLAWIKQVLQGMLEYPNTLLVEGQAIPPGLEAPMHTFGETLRPDLVLRHRETDHKPVLPISVYSPSQDLKKPVAGKIWKASPGTRMMELLHATDIPLGLVTNGEEWTLVSASRGETTGFASWYADLWMQEPITLRAFHSLLHLRRLMGVAEADTLAALYAESSKDQQEVTNQLGYQVRQAVEVLVQAFDRIDAESGRTLLDDVTEKALYDGALTIMMRLVFLFSAEERGLLMLGDPLYDQNYAVSTLSEQLREHADQYGEEILERRHDAWCRLIATFRAVHGGVQHESMRLPAYGGSLFDPDRYPFLEGRKPRSSWRTGAAHPLLINNRVVLHLLEALQFLRVKVPGGGPAEARRLSFRALDIEQIGHVYEGLLDHTAKRAREPILGLEGTKDGETEISLSELEQLASKGLPALVEFLKEKTGRSEKTLRRLVEDQPNLSDTHGLKIACGQDEALLARITPFAALLREDSFGQPIVVTVGSVYVTSGTDRRSTGTHYTPRSLTEPIVRYTLEPLVYSGPAEGLPENQWKLRTSKEILALKVCDMAMGSGAFLVEACRYLAERLAEAWEQSERSQPGSFVITPDGELSAGNPADRLIPRDAAERITIARRYVADRSLYGVDINPMAVEMAKLSLWLVTLQRDRPFSFLDHALRCGDSLLGVTSIDQIQNFSIRPNEQQITFATVNLFRYVDDAAAKRQALEGLPSNDQSQVKAKARLHAEAEAAIVKVKAIADSVVALELRGIEGKSYSDARHAEAEKVQALMRSDADALVGLDGGRTSLLSKHSIELLGDRRRFHWPVEFPEVFKVGGFDAFIGNPPFMGGRYISGSFGSDFLGYLKTALANGTKGNCDLVVYFYLRACVLLHKGGYAGYIGTKTITEGDTLEVGLLRFESLGADLFRADTALRWPGTAAVLYSIIHWSMKKWSGNRLLNSRDVANIGPRLDGQANNQIHNVVQSILPYQGSYIHGDGFLLTERQREAIIVADPHSEECIFPCLTGEDFNTSPTVSASRFAIYFGDLDQNRAMQFKGAWDHVEREVKPFRLKYEGTSLAKYWWRYKRPTKPLYDAIRKDSDFLACAVITKYLAFAWIPSRVVLMNKIYAFLHANLAHFTVLQSTLYEVWVRTLSANLGETLQFAPTDCFDNFPFPHTSSKLGDIGSQYHKLRQDIMWTRQEGMTKAYNRFHDQNEKSQDICSWRELRVQVDYRVAEAFGWGDLDCGHGYHETKQGIRFTVSESARNTVFKRLVNLNQQRYEQELHEGERKGLLKRRKPARQETEVQGSLLI